jgi:WhiB family redox-sensing transcriptional regulator
MTGNSQAVGPKRAPREWADRANCIGMPPDLFFPPPGKNRDIADARKVCADCCVRAECLDYAQTQPVEISGVWGGLSARDRYRLRRNGRKAVAS